MEGAPFRSGRRMVDGAEAIGDKPSGAGRDPVGVHPELRSGSYGMVGVLEAPPGQWIL